MPSSAALGFSFLHGQLREPEVARLEIWEAAFFAVDSRGTSIAYSSTMRVTSDISYRLLMESIHKNQSGILSSQQRLSSGVEVSKASDDPGAYGMIRALASTQAQLTQYERNANMAAAYHKTASDSLTLATDLMHRINEIGVKGGDGTLDPATREIMANEVDDLLKTMISAANGSDGGRYAFGGLRTDVPPYEAVLDPTDGRIVSVAYVGSEETRAIKIGESMTVATNYPGSTGAGEGGVFQTDTRDVFASIIALRDALANGDEIPNSSILDDLRGDLDHLLASSSLNGARQEQVATQQRYLLSMQTATKSARSDLESVDLAKETIRLTQAQTAYEAALRSTSTLLQQVSLLDYI